MLYSTKRSFPKLSFHRSLFPHQARSSHKGLRSKQNSSSHLWHSFCLLIQVCSPPLFLLSLTWLVGPQLSPSLLVFFLSTALSSNPRPLHDFRVWGEEMLLLKAEIRFSQCLWLVSRQFLIAGKSKSKGWSMFRASLCELSVSNTHILFKFQKIFHREGVKSTFLTLQLSFAKFKDSSPKQNCHSN